MLDSLHSTLLPWNGVGEGKIILVSISRTSCWMVLLVGFVRFLLLVEAFIIVPTLFPTDDMSSSLCSMICSSVKVSSSMAAANSRFSLQSSHRKTWRFGSSRAVASMKCSFPGPRTVFLKLCFSGALLSCNRWLLSSFPPCLLFATEQYQQPGCIHSEWLLALINVVTTCPVGCSSSFLYVQSYHRQRRTSRRNGNDASDWRLHPFSYDELDPHSSFQHEYCKQVHNSSVDQNNGIAYCRSQQRGPAVQIQYSY